MNEVNVISTPTLYDWQTAFIHAIKIKDVIFLHGNIRDIYLTTVNNEPFKPVRYLDYSLLDLVNHFCPPILKPVRLLPNLLGQQEPGAPGDWKTAIVHDIPLNGFYGPRDNCREERTIDSLNHLINHLPGEKKLIISLRSERLIPVFLYLNNPRVKMLAVTFPGEQQRLTFIQQHFPQEKENETNRYEHIPILLTDLTEGMTLRDTSVLLDFIPGFLGKALTEAGEKDLETAVNAFKFPGYRDYFSELPIEPVKTDQSKRSLYTAAGFFLPHEEVSAKEEAIEAIIGMVEKARSGIYRLQSQGQNLDRPKGVLFFCGPPGSGKTRTATKIAEFIFNDREAVIHFNMAATRQKEEILHLIDGIQRKPFAVILFHNISRAQAGLLEVAETILRNGRLEDESGATVYFSQAVIVFISIIGARTRLIGGRPHTEKQELDNLVEQLTIRSEVEDINPREAIKEHFVACLERFFREEVAQPQWPGLIGDVVVPFWFSVSYSGMMDSLRGHLKTLTINFAEIYKEQNLSLDIDIEGVAEILYKKYQSYFRQAGTDGIEIKIREDILPLLARLMTQRKPQDLINMTLRLQVDYMEHLEVNVVQ